MYYSRHRTRHIYCNMTSDEGSIRDRLFARRLIAFHIVACQIALLIPIGYGVQRRLSEFISFISKCIRLCTSIRRVQWSDVSYSRSISIRVIALDVPLVSQKTHLASFDGCKRNQNICCTPRRQPERMLHAKATTRTYAARQGDNQNVYSTPRRQPERMPRAKATTRTYAARQGDNQNVCCTPRRQPERIQHAKATTRTYAARQGDNQNVCCAPRRQPERMLRAKATTRTYAARQGDNQNVCCTPRRQPERMLHAKATSPVWPKSDDTQCTRRHVPACAHPHIAIVHHFSPIRAQCACDTH